MSNQFLYHGCPVKYCRTEGTKHGKVRYIVKVIATGDVVSVDRDELVLNT